MLEYADESMRMTTRERLSCRLDDGRNADKGIKRDEGVKCG
jgi:hypothetical protein